MKKIFSFLVCFVFCWITSAVWAVEVGLSQDVKKDVDVSLLKKIVVFDEGRVKPLDTYARVELLIINGKSTMVDSRGKKLSAIEWLARAMFTPSLALDDRVIKIVFPQVLEALGMAPNDSRRYSFNELVLRLPQLERLASSAGSKSDPNALDKEFLRIYDCFVRYYRIMNSFLFALPTETFRLPSLEVAKKLGLPSKQFQTFSYLDFMEVSPKLFDLAAKAEAKPEKKRSAQDFIVMEFKNRYRSFPDSYVHLPHLMIPSFVHEKQQWFSPWQIFSISSRENLVKKEILYLKRISEMYRAGDQSGFEQNVRAFLALIQKKLDVHDGGIVKKVNFEVIYNLLDPFFRAMLLYFFASMVIIFGALLKKYHFSSLWQNISHYIYFSLLGSAFLLHVGGLSLRMIITERPPITNLYTTFVFVSLVFILFCLILHLYEKGKMALFLGPLSAFLMLLISMKFADGGDSMGVLVAVLRSNFWLSTHVIAINLGYAGIVFSGVVGHVYLFLCLGKNAESPERIKKRKEIYSMLYATQAFGIIFTVLGTLLGGIWADQSWGRFWGWDPKENGSLMIVLWSAAILHARFSGLVKEIGLAAGCILGIIVVMFAWFGINLLGVGLHSYGFTEGIAYPFYLYVGSQFMVLFFLLYLIYQRQLSKK